jgi:hypothetical protein
VVDEVMGPVVEKPRKPGTFVKDDPRHSSKVRLAARELLVKLLADLKASK